MIMIVLINFLWYEIRFFSTATSTNSISNKQEERKCCDSGKYAAVCYFGLSPIKQGVAKLLAIIIWQIEVIFAELLAFAGSPACVLFAVVFFSFDRDIFCLGIDSVKDGVIRILNIIKITDLRMISLDILYRTSIMSGSGFFADLNGFYTNIIVKI